MKKLSYVLIGILVSVLIYVNLQGREGQIGKTSPSIEYDKAYIEQLLDFRDRQDISSFAKVYETKIPLVSLFRPHGWEGEPGDFERIQIKLGGSKVFELDNLEGWEKVEDWLELPKSSQKMHKNPYFISMDMERGTYILIFIGYHYSTGPPFLTLIYVSQDKAEMIFNKEVGLAEIAETAKGGYRLVGRLGGREYESNPCEITIEEGKLSFRRLPFEKVYENQFPSFVLYDCVGWGCNKQPGAFMRIQPTEGEQVTFDNYGGFWRRIDSCIKTPAKSQRIKKCPYFIMLDDVREGNCILVLCSCNYNGYPTDYLHLASTSSSYATSFRYIRNFKLKEIAETEQGYRLIGTTVSEQGEEQYCEHRIEDGAIVD